MLMLLVLLASIAVMDDTYFIGPPAPAFNAFDKFADALQHTGLTLNRAKTTALLPSTSHRYTSLCSSRHISYSSLSIPALGTILSRDRDAISSWLRDHSLAQ